MIATAPDRCFGFLRSYLRRVRRAAELLVVEPALTLVGVDIQQPRGTLVPPSREFVDSEAYFELMNRYVPYDRQYGLHEAFTYTRSYVHRHRTRFLELGVWRWRGMQEKRDLLLRIFGEPGGTIIDLGGAGCPLGMGSVVVDQLGRDKAGKKVAYHYLAEVPGVVGVIFACHVMEHIQNLYSALKGIRDRLAPGGWFVVFVPCFSNVGWQAGVHKNERFGSHLWTFGLKTQAKPPGLGNYVDIDGILGELFEVVEASAVGDDSLFILCRKPL